MLVGIGWIAPHLVTIYGILFKKSWRGNIPLSKIKTVERKALNQLEEAVILTLYSGRENSYTFRVAENQAEAFAELVNEFISANSLVMQ